MTSIVEKIRPVVGFDPGERLLCAAYVRWIDTRGVATGRPSMGPSVIAVSDRRLLYAPRSAFLSASAWKERRLEEVRVEVHALRRLGVVVGHRFEVIGEATTPLRFELDQRKDAKAFRSALARATVPSRRG